MYNLIVLTPYLNGRSSPDASSTANINFPAGSSYSSGFRKDDVLEAEEKRAVNGADWYRITKATRKDGSGNNMLVTLPTPVWASAGATYSLMRLYTPTPPVATPASEIILVINGVQYIYSLRQG